MFYQVLTYIMLNRLPFLCSKGRVFHLKQGPECGRWKGGAQASWLRGERSRDTLGRHHSQEGIRLGTGCLADPL
jgi:hypothetical protein